MRMSEYQTRLDQRAAVNAARKITLEKLSVPEKLPSHCVMLGSVVKKSNEINAELLAEARSNARHAAREVTVGHQAR